LRPIKLELKGFTAFRETCKIDFSEFDLFAITGPTGAGKTSLLDAMTYALYGKTSRLNKAGWDLVSQGANAMSVLLHFRVGAEEYQVMRGIRGSTVSARLEQREKDEWKPLSGSITGVNEEIQRIVGLDFSGFTKTVILPQGKFDVFLRGEAKERREVLCELLDVDVYQRMMKSANERSKDAGIRAEERAANIDAGATPEAKAESEQRLGELAEKVGSAAALCDKLRNSLTGALTLREKRTALATSRRELEHAGLQLMAAQTAAIQARQQVESQSLAIDDLHRQIESTFYDSDSHLRLNTLLPQARQQRKVREHLAAGEKKLEAARLDLAAAEEAVQRARAAQNAVNIRLQEAERLRGEAESAFKDLRLNHGSADAIQQVIKDLESARKEATDVPAIAGQIRQLEAREKTLATEVEAAGESIERARSDFETAEKLHEQLHARDRGAALRHELKPGEACPVCEQTVQKVPAAPVAGKLAKARQQMAQAKTSFEKAQNGLLELRGEAQSVPGKLAVAREQLQMRKSRVEQTTSRAQSMLRTSVEDPIPSLRSLINGIKAAELDAQEAHSRYGVVLKQQGEAGSTLQKAEHGKQLIESGISNLGGQIESFEQELGALDEVLRGAPALEEIMREIAVLEAAKKKRTELEVKRRTGEAALKQAEGTVVECGKSSAALESGRTRCEESIEALQKEIAKGEEQLKDALGDIALAGTPDEATQIERLEASSRQDLEALQAEVQKCRFGIDDLARRIERNEKLREEVTRLRSEGAVYRDLGNWLNAGNFQQYLLGSAFDILAMEGSKHLKELSGGRYEFAFEGDEFVVSDHSNGDETRSVRTLSGGESFLASLALALALAESITQLNGERGAVSLESLFLDEGFSTLDSETLSKVADAIEVLQNGKRLIGIITHVQSLADQMPVRIEIEKTVSGSRIAGLQPGNSVSGGAELKLRAS
jgi:exonuclease SbcC